MVLLSWKQNSTGPHGVETGKYLHQPSHSVHDRTTFVTKLYHKVAGVHISSQCTNSIFTWQFSTSNVVQPEVYGAKSLDYDRYSSPVKIRRSLTNDCGQQQVGRNNWIVKEKRVSGRELFRHLSENCSHHRHITRDNYFKQNGRGNRNSPPLYKFMSPAASKWHLNNKMLRVITWWNRWPWNVRFMNKIIR